MLKEMGCTVKQSTLNKWMQRVMGRVREAMAPLLQSEIQSSKFMHNDETRILVRAWNPERQKEEYRTCYIHGAYAPDCRLLWMYYSDGSRSSFRSFLRNGYIEFENNAIERLYRHLATGRRNWTHTGSHVAAKNIAFMYSLYESCVLNDICFNLYIEEVLERIIAGDTNYWDMLPNRISIPSKQQGAA